MKTSLERSLPLSSVAVVKGKDAEVMVKIAIGLLGGIETVVKKGDVVLIKPNLCCPKSAETGATTDPRIISTMIEIVKDADGKPIVGESPISGYDMEQVFDVTGVRQIAEEAGAKVVNLNEDSPVEVTIPNADVLYSVKVAKTVLDSKVIIGLPKMKTHLNTIVSLSLKNMKGVMWNYEKYKSHIKGLNQAIVDLNSLLKPHLVVMDGLIAMEGRGPTSGDPVEINLIIASKDPVAADAVASTIMGFSPEKIKHIKLAAERGLGLMDLNRIKILNEPIENVKRRFRGPRTSLGDLFRISLFDRVRTYLTARRVKAFG